MSTTEQLVKYRLARSIVTMDGTITIDTADDGTDSYSRASTVTIGAAADPVPEEGLTIKIDDRFGEKRKFDIKLADDGRLTGASDSTTGLGPQLVGDVVTLATAAAGIAAHVEGAPEAPENLVGDADPTDEAGPHKDTPSTIEAQYHEHDPDAADRRTRLQETVEALDDALVSAAEAAVAEKPISDSSKNQIADLSAALTTVRAELAVAETDFTTWKTATFVPRKVAFTRILGLDTLPRFTPTGDTHKFEDKEFRDQADTAATLGVMIAVHEAPRHDAPLGPDASADATLFYRIPRLVEIGVYVRKQDDKYELDFDDGVFELSQISSAWIIDKYSQVGRVELLHGFWEDRSTTLAFSTAGVLNELGNQDKPPLAAISTALDAAGGEITSTLNTVSTVSDAFKTTDPRTAALEAQVAEQELKARLATANATIAKAGTD